MADEPVYFGIKEIRELSFLIDMGVDFSDDQAFSFGYNVNLASVTADQTIAFTIEARFTDTGSGKVFIEGKSQTVFTIRDMKKYSRQRDGEEAIDLPDPMWGTMFGIAYSHARALLAAKTVGTTFAPAIMPLINPEQAFKQIFSKEYERNKRATGT